MPGLIQRLTSRRWSPAILLGFLAGAMAPAAMAGQLPIAEPVPGGIATVLLPPDTGKAMWQGRRLLVMHHDGKAWAIVGIPLNTAPGAKELMAIGLGHTLHVPFDVDAKQYRVQRLTIKNKSEVTLSAQSLARVKRERQQIDAVYATFTVDIGPARFPFSLPVQGRESSPFGAQRILNGKPRKPHSGIDIAAPAGTMVRAPADGVVALVGDFFFNGNTVVIDHGDGLDSVYVHLSHIDVQQGQHVHRGDPIAAVGATGRTTGADLHWTVTLNGTYINPELVLSAEALKSIQ